MKKKLKGWQIALLIIFYPVGIVYLIVKLCKKKKPSPSAAAPKLDIKYTFIDNSSQFSSNDRITNVKNEFLPLVTKKSIKEFLSNNTYIVLDLETSGLSKYKNEIIEIAMLKIVNGKESGRYNSFIKPSQPIDEKITKLTGITNDDLSNAPSFSQVADDVLSFIGNFYIVAHNCKFDVGFLSEALEPRSVTIKCVDTLPLARKALPELENHKLQSLMKHYEISDKQEHRAMSDVECTQKIFVLLCNDILSHVNKREPVETK